MILMAAPGRFGWQLVAARQFATLDNAHGQTKVENCGVTYLSSRSGPPMQAAVFR